MSIRTKSSEKSLFLMGWMNELAVHSLPGRDDKASKPDFQTSKLGRHQGSKVQNGCVSLDHRTTAPTESDRCCCYVYHGHVVSKDVFAQQSSKTDNKNTNFSRASETCRHSREKEELVSRNLELEKQLQEARRTIRAHEERLLIYSQMINSHSLALNQNLAGCPSRAPVGRSQPDATSMKNYYSTNRCGRQARAVDSLSTDSTLSSLNSGNYSDFCVVPR